MANKTPVKKRKKPSRSIKKLELPLVRVQVRQLRAFEDEIVGRVISRVVSAISERCDGLKGDIARLRAEVNFKPIEALKEVIKPSGYDLGTAVRAAEIALRRVANELPRGDITGLSRYSSEVAPPQRELCDFGCTG